MKKMKQFLIAFVLILTMCTPAVYADEASDYYSSMMSSTSDKDTAIQAAQSYMSAFAAMTMQNITKKMQMDFSRKRQKVITPTWRMIRLVNSRK